MGAARSSDGRASSKVNPRLAASRHCVMATYMQFRHGGLALTIPDDWSDQSTIRFVGPPEPSAALPTLASSGAAGQAVQIDFFLAQGGSPRAFLEAQLAAVAEVDEEMEILAGAPFTCGLGEGWQVVQRLTLDGYMSRQIVACVFRGEAAVVVSAATSEGRFGAVQASLQKIMASIGPAPGAS